MAITLAELKLQARYKADMVDSDFVEDAELLTYINSSIAELHDLLVSSYGNDYFLASTTITILPNVDNYSLPSTFYKLRGVDAMLNNSEWTTLKQFNFNERNRFTQLANYNSLESVRYRIQGSSIYFVPSPDQGTTVKVWFTPLAVKLEDDSDELNDLNQYAEYVITDAAIKMLQKEETDVSLLLAQKEALRQRITSMAANRDSGDSPSITDIYAANTDYWHFK